MNKYIIITPVRNEEAYIEKTIQAVINQTLKPIEWIIVNDGSMDGTKDIVEKYIGKFPWIKKIDLENKGFRPGKGPAEAFNEGYRHITVDYEFIVNLDGDVSFDSTYFEKLFRKFEEYPNLGIASGKLYYLEKGKLNLYRSLDISTMGASKVYKKQCFKDIGGTLANNICWDMIDDLEAQMKGWQTKSFKDLKFIHYKIIGKLQGNIFKSRFKMGQTLYSYGYHPVFIIAKGIYRMFEKPYIIGGIAIILGYFKALIRKEKQIDDKEMIKFLRKKQLRMLTFRSPFVGKNNNVRQ